MPQFFRVLELFVLKTVMVPQFTYHYIEDVKNLKKKKKKNTKGEQATSYGNAWGVFFNFSNLAERSGTRQHRFFHGRTAFPCSLCAC